MNPQPKLTRRETYGYSLGALCGGMAFNLVRSFFMYYSTDILGVSAGFLAVMFFVARLFDAFTDPVMGTLSENIKTPWGKHKPWVLTGAVINALVVVMMFSPWLVRLANPVVAVTVLYVLFGITYTIIDVPYYAYAASFTDLKERDTISVIPRLVGGLAMFGVPVLTLPMVGGLGGESASAGFFRWALILMGVYVLSAAGAAKSMKIREIGTREQPFSFREALQTLKGNDQLLIIEAVFILAMTAISITQAVALYYFKYVWRDPDAFGLFMLTVGTGMGIAMLSYTLLVKKVTRRNLFIISSVLPIIGYVAMFILTMFTHNVYFLLPIVLSTVGGFGFFGIFTSVFMVDTVEYGEWKQGYRSENLVFSLLTFIGKFSGAIAALITMGGLQLAGFVPTREDLLGTFDGATQITAQPASVDTALNVLMFGAPPLILALALWLFLKKYKLHGDFLAKITQELEEKRNIAKQEVLQ